MTGSGSEQLQPVDPLTSLAAHVTVSAVNSNNSDTAVDPKYVQLLGDKAAVSVTVNILIFPVTD